MTREPITDPEVLADLALRERTAHERADRRTPAGLEPGQDLDGLSPSLAKLYDAAPDPIVEHWPCRGDCGTMVGVTKVGVDEYAAMNRRLRSMRQEPVPKSKVMWCPDCKKRDEELAQMARRPAEQLGMKLDANRPEPSSGMRAQSPRRSRR